MIGGYPAGLTYPQCEYPTTGDREIGDILCSGQSCAVTALTGRDTGVTVASPAPRHAQESFTVTSSRVVLFEIVIRMVARVAPRNFSQQRAERQPRYRQAADESGESPAGV